VSPVQVELSRSRRNIVIIDLISTSAFASSSFVQTCCSFLFKVLYKVSDIGCLVL
jgi:hypothetical protein